MDEGYAVTLESLHVICLALMMVIKNSCVPVSFPANPQEKIPYLLQESSLSDSNSCY